MAITITNDDDWQSGSFLYSDDDCVFEWTSTESNNTGYFTIIEVNVDGTLIYKSNRYDFRFNLKDILSSYMKLNTSSNITTAEVGVVFGEAWVSGGNIIHGAIGALPSPRKKVFLKGTSHNLENRIVGMLNYFTTMPEGCYYYAPPNNYTDDIVKVLVNDLSQVTTVTRESMANNLGIIERPFDCGNACQLIWRNDYSAEDSFFFTHNYRRDLRSEGLTWGYPKERTIIKNLTDGVTVHTGSINYITYKWLVEELLKSPYILFKEVYAGGTVVKEVMVEDVSKEILRDTFGETLNLSFKLKFINKRKSIRT